MSLYVELLRHFFGIFKKQLITVDVVIKRKDSSIVLVKRKFPPFQGHWALPGGFASYGTTLEESAVREAKEETGLDVRITKLVGVFSDPKRDTRGHIITTAYLAEEIGGELKAGSDAAEARAFKKIPKKLAFDHAEILKKAGIL